MRKEFMFIFSQKLRKRHTHNTMTLYSFVSQDEARHHLIAESEYSSLALNCVTLDREIINLCSVLIFMLISFY